MCGITPNVVGSPEFCTWFNILKQNVNIISDEPIVPCIVQASVSYSLNCLVNGEDEQQLTFRSVLDIPE